MGSDSSKLKHSVSTGDSLNLPSIRLPSPAFPPHPCTRKASDVSEISRSRKGSACSRGSGSPRHPMPVKMRRLIQSCFSNPHESLGRRVCKRACEARSDFAAFFIALDPETREQTEDAVKMLLKKLVTNIDFVDEVQRLSEEFGGRFVEMRACGFKADLFAVLADATIKECTHLDSAVHKAHTTTAAFSQFGAMVFSAVRDGFYQEVRKRRRASNSFSTGSAGSQRKKSSIDSQDGSRLSSRGASPRGSPRSLSPDADSCFEGVIECADDGLLKPHMAMLTTRTY